MSLVGLKRKLVESCLECFLTVSHEELKLSADADPGAAVVVLVAMAVLWLF